MKVRGGCRLKSSIEVVESWVEVEGGGRSQNKRDNLVVSDF